MDLELEYRNRCADGVVEIVVGNKSVEEVRRELERWLEFLSIVIPRENGSLEIGSMIRANRELRNPVDAIQNCANWVSGRSKGASWAFPFREIRFYRGEHIYGQMVRERWSLHAGNLNRFLPRMIAPKDHPIWADFGDFRLPWGPFFKEELSGGELGIILMGVKRSEVMDLGIWRSGDVIMLLPPDVNPEMSSQKFLADAWRVNQHIRISASFPEIMVNRKQW